jgi:hypothetical protein
MAKLKVWHGVVVLIAVVAVAGLLSITLGLHVFFAH